MTHGFSNWCSDDDRCDVTVPHPSGVPVPCARPVDHPVHTAAAPTEQATHPAEVCDCANHENQVCDICQRWHEGIRDRRAADADSTAERSPVERDWPCGAVGPEGVECRLRYGHAAHVGEPHLWTDAWKPEVSAGSPVTAGVPDTSACGCVEGYEWRARQDAVCGNCPRRSETPVGIPDTTAEDWLDLAEIEGRASTAGSTRAYSVGPLADSARDVWPLISALHNARAQRDAARGELVTARGERDAWEATAVENEAGYKESLRAWRADMDTLADERDEAIDRAERFKLYNDEFVVMAASVKAEREQWQSALAAANARITAALAVISSYDDIRDTCRSKADGRQCLLCDLRDALGVPAAGDAP